MNGFALDLKTGLFIDSVIKYEKSLLLASETKAYNGIG
jgi:hypothetical protein